MALKFLGIQIFLITTLAALSQYKIPDFSQSSWQIARFLTPYGIVENYIYKNNSVMWSFYKDISENPIAFSEVAIGAMIFTYLLLAISAFYFLRNINN